MRAVFPFFPAAPARFRYVPKYPECFPMVRNAIAISIGMLSLSKALWLFAVFFLLYFSKAESETVTADFSFYNKKYTVFYDNSILVSHNYITYDGYFEEYYKAMDTTLYEIFLNDLHRLKKVLALNDWLYYQLIRSAVSSVFSKQKGHFQTMFIWFLLSKSGYETRLEFKGKEITISVFSHDLVYGVQQSKSKGGFWIDITSFHNTIKYEKWEPFRVNFTPVKNGVPFSFGIPELPKIFERKTVEKEIIYSHSGLQQSVIVTINKNYIDFLKDYPEVSVLKHTNLTLSPDAGLSLINHLKKQTANMDTIKVLRYLLSFTRLGFQYKKDEEIHGGKKLIYAPEETLYYGIVDSEDISILYFYLAKQLLNAEMVLLKYGKRTSVAAVLRTTTEKPLTIENKQFTLCDPLGPDDKQGVGIPPESLKTQQPAVIEK